MCGEGVFNYSAYSSTQCRSAPSALASSIYVNLFIGNETQITVGEQKVHLSLETDFPWKNQFKINVSGVKESVQLAVRIPEYAQDYKIFCEGREQFYKEKDGYAYITCEKNGRYEVQFVSEPRPSRVRCWAMSSGGSGGT